MPRAVARVAAESRVLVGFENASPEKPYALGGWDAGAGSLERLNVVSPDIRLGDASAAFVALAANVDAALAKLQAAFDAHVHVAAGTPTAVPTTVPNVVSVGPLESVAATKVKAT